jgi:pyridoxine 5-phosphate synthase
MSTILLLRSYANRVSLFIDPNIESVDYAKSVAADCIELYTEDYANSFKSNDVSSFGLVEGYKEVIIHAKSLGLRVNAGHDLNLENLPALKALNLIDEVSIGHAIIVDALNFGFEDTIKRYIQLLKVNYEY